MNLKIISSVALAIGLSGCGALKDTTDQSFRMFPPAPANVQVNNAAWLVGHGPYKDDCWMYGFGCAPPGATDIVVVDGNPNPAFPIYVAGPQARPTGVRVRHRYSRLKLRRRLITKD